MSSGDESLIANVDAELSQALHSSSGDGTSLMLRRAMNEFKDEGGIHPSMEARSLYVKTIATPGTRLVGTQRGLSTASERRHAVLMQHGDAQISDHL